MKITKSKILMAAGVAFVAQSLAVTPVRAQELYRADVHAVSVATNSSGGLSYHRYGNREIIQDCATEAGLTNLEGLQLVYDPMADALEVVSGTNQVVVCTPMMFSGGVALSKTNNTVEERISFVSLETNSVVNGTLRATERFKFGPTNQVTHFDLRGSLQFAQPADGTNPPVIYSGTLSAGNFGRDEEPGEQGTGRHNGR